MKTDEFFDLLTEECTECEDGKVLVPAYGNTWSKARCYTCRGTRRMPSAVGRELLGFIKQYE
jgi:hypothetical protein